MSSKLFPFTIKIAESLKQQEPITKALLKHFNVKNISEAKKWLNENLDMTLNSKSPAKDVYVLLQKAALNRGDVLDVLKADVKAYSQSNLKKQLAKQPTREVVSNNDNSSHHVRFEADNDAQVIRHVQAALKNDVFKNVTYKFNINYRNDSFWKWSQDAWVNTIVSKFHSNLYDDVDQQRLSDYYTNYVSTSCDYVKDVCLKEITNQLTECDSDHYLLVNIILFANMITEPSSETSYKFRIPSINEMYSRIISGTVNDIHLLNVISSSGDQMESIRSNKSAADFVTHTIDKCYREIFSSGASSLVFDSFSKVIIISNKKKLSRGGSYIATPEFVAKKHCCVNVKNDDDMCIIWAMLSHYHYDDIGMKSHRTIAKYYEPWLSEINYTGINFPITDTVKDISKLEKLNNIKINIFEVIEYKPAIIYNSRSLPDIPYKDTINILQIRDAMDCLKVHFILIRNFNSFMRSSTSYNSPTDHFHWCTSCLSASFLTEEKLQEHRSLCTKNECVRCVLPEAEKAYIKFRNQSKQFKHPFCCFADMETTLVDVDIQVGDGTQRVKKHVANSIGIKFDCIYAEFSKPIKIINNSNQDELMREANIYFEELTKYAYELTQTHKTFDFANFQNYFQRQSHFNKTTCDSCKCTFDKEKHKKCAHHDHISGQFLGTICKACNFEFSIKPFMPIYFHNLKGYDSHFIILALSNNGDEDISCIPNNEEKYISFSKNIVVGSYVDKKTNIDKEVRFEMRFLDTLAFMNTSLSALGENIRKSCRTSEDIRTSFPNLSEAFPNDIQLQFMTQKGVYPYDYINAYDRLFDNQLPSIDCFYNKLCNEPCSVEDYDRACQVWTAFECKTMMDYHNLYLTSDVLLLSDIWKNFCKICMNVYGLDPCYYYTSPGLSWDAMLKTIHDKDPNFKLELITDMDMYLMFESGIRGGLSQISKRYAKANNPNVENYDESKPLESIMYYDANNLYGGAMRSYLPYGKFQWNSDIWTEEKILALDDEGSVGYQFKVDIHYPEELHDLHNGYPCLPENRPVENAELNAFQSDGRSDNATSKLITSLNDKKQYVINYRHLKLVLSLGLKLGTVHNVISYSQAPFIRNYIDLNTSMRTIARNDFEKDFYKLMNNSIFGKTMENIRNRINFKLIKKSEQSDRLRCHMKKFTIFKEGDDGLVGVHLLKTQVILNKPIYIGQNILDESKSTMVDFHYNVMLKHYGRENIDLLFTDTDSLCYHIKNMDPYKMMLNNKQYFDLSEYPRDNELFDETNKKVVLKFKDECSGYFIREFVGLKAKMYSYIKDAPNGKSKEIHRAKGIKRCVNSTVDGSPLDHNAYLTSLHDYSNRTMIQQSTFRSHKHELYTEIVTKIGLSPTDDKVFICNDMIHTMSHGHKDIPTMISQSTNENKSNKKRRIE